MTTKIGDFVIPITILFLATIVIAATDADLKLSALFYIDGKWPIGDQQPWHLLYVLESGPAIVLALFGLATAISGTIYKQRRSWIRPGLFLLSFWHSARD